MERLFLLNHKTKLALASISLLALGVVFEALSKLSSEMKHELSDWKEGRTFSLGILPDGPSVTMRYESGRIRYLGKGLKNPDLAIYFKSVDMALMVFLGMIGAHTSSIQSRTIVHGDLGETMQMVRAMNLVVKYLMPGILFGKLFKRPPKMSAAQLALKTRIMMSLPVALAMNAGK